MFHISLSPFEGASEVKRYLSRHGGADLLHCHQSGNEQGLQTAVLIYEKYYFRNSSRASLTVVLDNLNGRTQVLAVGSGGGQGMIFRFDWGAAENFEDLVARALQEYRIS